MKLTFLALLIFLSFTLPCLQTDGYAQVTADPIGFAEALDEGQQSTQVLTLANATERAIPFEVKFRKVDRGDRQGGPARDDPGDEVRHLDVPANNVGGMAFDGEIMWGSSYGQANLIWGIDPENDEVVARFNAAGNPLSLAFDGENLWTTTWASSTITVFDREGNRVEAFDLRFSQHSGMATDADGHILINCNTDQRIHVINIEDHQEVTSFTYRAAMGNTDVWGIEWVDAHPEGQLWGVSANHHWQVFVDEEWRCEAVQDYAVRSEFQHVELAHDGENMWHGMWNVAVWYVIDDGVTEVYWLNVAPKEGNLQANSETELEFTFNSDEMSDGLNEFWIDLEFPDDEEYNIRMSAVLTVGDQSASIQGTVTDAATGNPIEGAIASLYYYTYERPSNEEGFYDLANLPPRAYQVTFTAPDYLPTSEDVNLQEDDAELNVALLHSECALSEERIEMELAPDTDTHIEFTLSNGGNGPLGYTVERRLIGDANAAPWELRRDYNVGQVLEDDRIEGVTFDGTNFYLSGANGDDPNMIYVTDREGEPVGSFVQPGESRYGMKDLEFDGELIWGSGEQRVFGFDGEGNVQRQFQGPFNPTGNIAWDSDQEVLWLSGTTTNIVGYTRDGEAIGVTLNRKNLRIYGLSYWPDDPDGYSLYILNFPAAGQMVVHKMNTANGDTMRVRNIVPREGASPGGAFICNTFDVYSWVMMFTSNVPAAGGADRTYIYQLDARKEWFQIDPTEGVVQAGETQDFDLHLDAAGLPAVVFEGELFISHDGVGSTTILPIRLDVVEGPVHSERRLQLGMGWNLVSTNLQPDEDDIAVLTQGLDDAGLLTMVKDDEGHFYTPSNGYSNLNGWEVAEGYWLKLRQPAELRVPGVTVMSDDPIALHNGWQAVSYYPRRAVDAMIALSGIENVLRIAKDGAGNFYLPDYGYSNLGDLREGRGYQLKTSEAAELVYRTRLDGVASRGHRFASIYDQPSRYALHPVTGRNMSLLVKSDHIDGTDVGVYANNVLIGCGILESGMAGVAAWGDDPTTVAIDGAKEGEALTLRLRDDQGERETSARLIDGELTYTTDGLTVIEVEAVATPTEFGLTEAYPNPFNSTLTASFALSEAGKVKAGLFDLSGREVMNLTDGMFTAGRHQLSLNGDHLSSGIYVLRLESLGRVSQMKVTLVK